MTPGKGYLLADVGGTNTRVAIKWAGQPPARIEAYQNRDFPNIETLLRTYLEPLDASVSAGVLAVASPVDSDRIQLTNRGWTFSVDALRGELGLETLRVFNDFTAVALALPALRDDQLVQIGAGNKVPKSTLAVLGPGTGLGVSGLVPCENRWAPIAGEGGHATLAPTTAEESRLFALLHPKLGHLSAETLLSGPGLMELYCGLGELRQAAVEAIEAEEITRRAVAGRDPLAVDAWALFLTLLGGFAGDVALILGARGGVYLAGGILPGLSASLEQSAFRARFEAKGRMREYVQAIPTYVITDRYPALTGLSAWIEG